MNLLFVNNSGTLNVNKIQDFLGEVASTLANLGQKYLKIKENRPTGARDLKAPWIHHWRCVYNCNIHYQLSWHIDCIYTIDILQSVIMMIRSADYTLDEETSRINHKQEVLPNRMSRVYLLGVRTGSGRLWHAYLMYKCFIRLRWLISW